MPPDLLEDALRALGLIVLVTVVLAAARAPAWRGRIASLFRAPPPPPGPGEPPPEAPSRTGRICVAVAVALVVILRGRELLHFQGPPGILIADLGFLPMLQATSAISAFQLAASAAGRGRALPFLGAVSWVRLGLVAVHVAVLMAQVSEYLLQPGAGAAVPPAIAIAAGLGLSTTYLVLVEASARARGPSVAVAGFIAGTAILCLGPLRLWPLLSLASFGAVALALRRLGLSRERLRRLGITPWAPSELGLVPDFVAQVLIVPLAWTLAPSIGTAPSAMLAATAAASIATTVATILALRYLDRRLREAEAFAAARAAAPAEARA